MKLDVLMVLYLHLRTFSKIFIDIHFCILYNLSVRFTTIIHNDAIVCNSYGQPKVEAAYYHKS
jgi:hypothetical protein